MTSDERRESLADQAAAWIPPWARERSAEPAEEAVEDPPEAVVDEPAAAVEEPVAAEDPPAVADDAPEDPPAVADDVPEDRPAVADDAPEAVAETPGRQDLLAQARATTASHATAAVPAPGARAVSALALIDDDELRAALEAILLVVDEPVAEIVLAQVLEQPVDRVRSTLDRIARDYTEAGHGFELRRAAGGWRLYTRPEYASYVERFILDGQSVRLTQAALETLAVVAYKQPVTRSRISAIRGVNCDGVIRTLVSRGLVQECGTEPDSGAYLYRTTTLFLEKLGLDRVDELPPLAPFLPDDVEEIIDAPR